jgi:flagellar assembly factor FliW
MGIIAQNTTMNIEGTRFGTIEFTEEDVVLFPEGLVGFSRLHRHVLVNPKPNSPFRYLQSLEEPGLAFLVTDPTVYMPDYDPKVDEGIAKSLELAAETPRLLFTTVSIPHGHPEDMTVNLAAPIVINLLTRKAKQIVLDDQAYTIKHRVFQPAVQAGEKQVA